jgi:hypothetical protein
MGRRIVRLTRSRINRPSRCRSSRASPDRQDPRTGTSPRWDGRDRRHHHGHARWARGRCRALRAVRRARQPADGGWLEQPGGSGKPGSGSSARAVTARRRKSDARSKTVAPRPRVLAGGLGRNLAAQRRRAARRDSGIVTKGEVVRQLIRSSSTRGPRRDERRTMSHGRLTRQFTSKATRPIIRAWRMPRSLQSAR